MPASALTRSHSFTRRNQMMYSHLKRTLPRLLGIFGALALLAPAAASAHARISPAVSVKRELQLYSLAVPTEKESATTSKIVMTVPSGFGIDSFVPPPPGWTQQVRQTGSGEEAIVTQVTWTGG